MAVALTPFEAMCGFRSIEEIASNIKKYPELAACISPAARTGVESTESKDEAAVKQALQAFLESFMNCEPEVVQTELPKLLSRIDTSGDFIEGVVCRLASQYPGDSGAMAPFFLNVLALQPGEAFFMGANEPHAYLSGEILECMACSDNVVRAGLTPKLKDVPVLVSSLTYRSGAPEVMRPAVKRQHDGVEFRRYQPEAVQDFQVDTVRMAADSTFVLEASRGPRILLVMEGEAKATLNGTECELTTGSVLFIAAGNAPQVSGSTGIFFSVAGPQM
jgi:mannose-6-phosphate isomerase